MKWLVFAKRNFKELIRDPLSLMFNIGLPIALLIILEILFQSFGEDAVNNVPQFQINNFSVAMCIFSFSFLMLFSAILVSKDETTAFLTRLKISPMKSSDFLLGYIISFLPICLIQIILVFGVSIIFFGLSFTPRLILLIPFLLLCSSVFICMGILIGISFNDKAASGISSIFIQICALFGGVFMPIDNLNKGFRIFCYTMPFANMIKLSKVILNNITSNLVYSSLNLIIWLVVVVVLTLVIFRYKLKKK